VELHVFGKTDVGKKRDHNEDSFLVDQEHQLYLVADGMGGHAAGEVASSITAEVVRDYIGKHEQLLKAYNSESSDEDREEILKVIKDAALAACMTVFNKGQKDKQRHGMGTTLSAMLITGNGAFIAHVGDSRIYLVRENLVHQLTVDHTLVNEQLRRGTITKEEARKANYQNVITRAIGVQKSVRVDTLHLDILPKDKFIICSDGLHGYLKPGDIENIIGPKKEEEVTTSLIDLANERGGKDNISVIYVSVGDDDEGFAEEARQRMKLMQETPLFKYLTYRELVNIMNLTYTRTVRDGEMIIKEGEVADELFILIKGEARVLKGDLEIARLPTGSHFGEMALIDNAPRSATIKAIGTTRLLVVGRNKFYGFIRRDTGAGIKMLWSFLQILTFRLRNTDERLREAKEELSIQEIKPEWILLDE
jgi:serine/threonine protein phosphatase PrpC